MTANNKTEHSALEQRDVEKITQALDMNSNDAKLNEQLAEMRKEALRHLPEGKSARSSHTFMWSSFGAAAAALVLFFTISQPPIDDSDSVEDSLALLSEAEELEMLESHDIEFYVWLEGELAESKG